MGNILGQSRSAWFWNSRMKNQLCLGAALLFLALSFPCAQSNVQPATSQQRPAAHPQPRDRAEGLIALDVMVTDPEGKPVAGLNAASFHLLEQGRDQRILSFDPFEGVALRSEPAVKIILLLDKFQVPTEIARDEEVGIEAFLRKDGKNLS